MQLENKQMADEQSALTVLRHDLVTPVGHIIGYGEMVIEELQERSITDLIPDVQKMHGAAKALLALIDDHLAAASHGTPRVVVTRPGVPEAASRDYEPASAIVEAANNDAAEEPAQILIVDDNDDNRTVLERRLSRQGHAVTAACGGAEALNSVAHQDFDLVLLDIMMPEVDGYEVLARIKGASKTHHIPVIMISAVDEMDSVVRCIEMGAADYLPKPFNMTLLGARVNACLRAKRSHDREKLFTRELQESYKRLQDLERLRGDLTRMIVHDLRTPLTSVMAGLQMIQYMGDVSDEQQEMVDIAVDGGQTLLDMINELLDVEKMEAGVLRLSSTELSAEDLAARAVALVAKLAESNSLQIVEEIEPDMPPFAGDGEKLLRTLVNLLGNALKFTQPGGTVTIATRLADDGATIFSVADTGEGIPEEAFERIFEKFGQLESRRGGRTMSTGLGLTFCKLVVEAHGGKIKVESVPGEGSTFSFWVPRK